MPNTVSPLAFSRQLILVVASTWQSATAKLQRFERESADSDWRCIGGSIKVSLGKSGLAWGIGLHGEISAGEPVKKEGDGCAPAGIFAITSLFGCADQKSRFALAARLPYQMATPDLKCIDDGSSRHYNQIIDQSCLKEIDWHSCEEMLRNDERYVIGAVVAHNSSQRVPGAGSCIFIHVWQSEGGPTAGCTAGSLADISELCGWLDGAAAPLLVQLPRSEYFLLKDAWALPLLSE